MLATDLSLDTHQRKEGNEISDEQIKECLNELICADGFPYVYNKLTVVSIKEMNDQANRLLKWPKHWDSIKP